MYFGISSYRYHSTKHTDEPGGHIFWLYIIAINVLVDKLSLRLSMLYPQEICKLLLLVFKKNLTHLDHEQRLILIYNTIYFVGK